MTKEKIVIALGGNALQSGNGPATAEAQLEVVKNTCKHIAAFKSLTSKRIEFQTKDAFSFGALLNSADRVCPMQALTLLP